MVSRPSGTAAAVLAVLFVCTVARSAPAQVASGFGVMGDSGSDEYRGDSNKGGAYAATTFNWMELLARYRGLNFGTWGSWPAPRRTGYQYNWALSGATSADVISGGQAAGLAQQVAAGQVGRVVLDVGVNDLVPILTGGLAGAAVQTQINATIANITQALDTVQAAGPVDLFVETLTSTDPVIIPAVDPATYQTFLNALTAVNTGIIAAASARGITVIDKAALLQQLVASLDANDDLHVDGALIDFATPGDEPHHAILSDDHSGTVLSGLIANTVVASYNLTGTAIVPFSDEELLTNAGIGPPDTTLPAISLTSPLAGATVSGSVAVAASASDNTGVASVQFQIDGANLGSPDTSAPYSATWNATNVSPGPHVVTAVAKDAAGNSASASITVTVKDVAPPTVSITSPSNNAQIVGTLTVKASASDNIGVAGVTFYWGSTALGPEQTAAPYTISVPTNYTEDGKVTLTAVARDTSGNLKTSSGIVVTIADTAPDTTSPVVSVSAPAAGATVSNTVTVSANASDNVNVVGVQFKLDGVALGSEDTSSPYSLSWNTTTAANGPHTLSATARDAAGNTTTASESVTVLNLQPETKYPSADSVDTGAYQGGTLQSLVSVDNNFFTVGSSGSFFSYTTQTELQFTAVAAPVTRLDLSATLKSSRSSTSITLYAFSVATNGWHQVGSATAGTSEITVTGSITSSPGSYVNASGIVRLMVQSHALLTHVLSLDAAHIAVTH